MLDLLVTGARIVDGTGEAAFPGAVGISGERIAGVWRDDATPRESARTIVADGRVVAPGFIDVHNHSDLSSLVLPTFDSYVRQGVTTVVVGNCGFSPWPAGGFRDGIALAYGDPDEFEAPTWPSYGDYLGALDHGRPAVNIATLVGHGTVRQEVLGLQARPPSDEELDRMRSLVRDAMEAGAFGVSTGLIYVPGIFAATDEVVALAEVSAQGGGLYASHIRGEGEHLFRAIDEALEIGRRAGLPVHVSHLKCESSLVWGRAADLLARLAEAEDATGDQYPYAAWNSSLSSLLPPWAPVGGLERLVRDPAARDRLRGAVEEGEHDFQSSVRGVGWDRIVVVGTADDRWRGMDVASIADEMGFDPFAACVRLLIEDPDTSCIGHAMHEDDVHAILSDPSVFVASDGSADAPDGPGAALPVHPREYGTFPRALALARDRGLLPMEAVVRKMTALPAERFGLRERGRLVEGAIADLVVFDPGGIHDTATFETPHAFPEGVSLVVVGGQITWEAGASEIARNGRVLYRGSG
jgi:N-acyl-D-aspartate/D-glutamate deacylase